MPRIRHTGATDAQSAHTQPLSMSLDLECYADELSPAQLAAYQTAESEHISIRSKLNEIVNVNGTENLFLGELFAAYQVPGPAAASLDEIAKPIAVVRKEHQQQQQLQQRMRPLSSPTTASSADDRKSQIKSERDAMVSPAVGGSGVRRRFGMGSTATSPVDRASPPALPDDNDDDDYVPIAKRVAAKVAKLAADKKKAEAEKLAKGTPGRKTSVAASPSSSSATAAQSPVPLRPSENSSIGGLSVGDRSRAKRDVVDLTKEEPTVTGAKGAADSREVTFNKLQGKTYPSLVVVARPSLRIKDSANDRPALDAKVKSVLMHTATKFTEWLIQQGLVRSEQNCHIHVGKQLKLGMYSDATKFAFSGGYVWISECCPNRFVSVFNGSLFEGAPHSPSVLLKLIYHWSCQTNVQNVVQWVKVDNLYVKGLYTMLRSVCTVALAQHMKLLGGLGKKIEVGVISLGTTSQDGQQRQVKVEVLGVLDADAKVVRLRAVEPLSDGERNFKKRFAKILEPLTDWVHADSTIYTDLTVDKATLQQMGFAHVVSVEQNDRTAKHTNANIMDYLRRIVPRMFQNTLSLLSREIIQQFLDELVWREWYGLSPNHTFDNIVAHISEQTRLDAKPSFVERLNEVAANPFKCWSHLSVKTPAKALRDNFFLAANHPSMASGSASSSSSASAGPSTSGSSKALASTSAASATATAATTTTPGKRGRKRREPSPEYVPNKKLAALASPATSSAAAAAAEELKNARKLDVKTISAMIAAKRLQEEEDAKRVSEMTTMLESYYYGVHDDYEENDSAAELVEFQAQCPKCSDALGSNIQLMDHLKVHANNGQPSSVQCRYCLENWGNQTLLEKHLLLTHPLETRSVHAAGYACLICGIRCSNPQLLANHMQKTHVTLDLPFRCGCCNFASSSQRHTIDHFYTRHEKSGVLQCPFCLQIFCATNAEGKALDGNTVEYLDHLKLHVDAVNIRKCFRCVLAFTHKGSLKVHQVSAHSSFHKKGVKAFSNAYTKIAKPKYKYNYQNLNMGVVVFKHDNIKMAVGNGHLCLECGVDFEEKCHFTGLMKCPKCKYTTSCARTMLDHSGDCTGSLPEHTAQLSPLDQEMHCICGFSSTEGNALARHLVTCGRRSAYATVEQAQENTVQRNMLDMLGLVRRGGENNDDEADGGTNSDEQSLAHTTSEPEAATEPSEAGGDCTAEESEATTESVEPATEVEETVPDDKELAEPTVAEQQQQQQEQFNTELSLDDLAAPPSVAPAPVVEPEDRTPQLNDEYQSLATPRVALPVEHAVELMDSEQQAPQEEVVHFDAM